MPNNPLIMDFGSLFGLVDKMKSPDKSQKGDKFFVNLLMFNLFRTVIAGEGDNRVVLWKYILALRALIIFLVS